MSEPQTAYWHFGWHVTDVRKNIALYKTPPRSELAPLYTTDEGGSVLVSSDTWPGTGGVLGLTKAQIADAKAEGVKPPGGAGFAYMRGPDNALIEYQGNMPAERFNHVHMYQDDPFCALLWYRTHLERRLSRAAPASAPARTGRLQSAARAGPHLAGAGKGGHVPHARGGRHVRRCGDDLVHAPDGQAAGAARAAI